ncbi:hypothetical protein CMO93_06260 [Candidatus Woesearchaeota archaeon]|nr:hypothetical protein [Candidatus Woesearchaeota archaeon]
MSKKSPFVFNHRAIFINILNFYTRKMKKKNQYDIFLYIVQQLKMKELWDNKEDETWENA